MNQQCEEYARLLFLNEFDRALVELRSELGAIANKEAGSNTLISSQCFNKNHHQFVAFARRLSDKRLELDLQALKNFGLKIKDEVGWLQSNQSQLIDNYWNHTVLAWYFKPMWNGKADGASSQVWAELNNIQHQKEREIRALSLPPEIEQVSKSTIQNNYNYGGMQNIASGNATVNATMTINNADLDKLIPKLIELLKSSDLPTELKEETIDIAETIADQVKFGEPKKSLLKMLGGKMKEVKDAIVGTDATIVASKDLYNTANELGKLILQAMS